MRSKKRLSTLLWLQRCFWLLVASWLVEQQDVCSSEASQEKPTTEAPEVEVPRGTSMDAMSLLYAKMAAEQDVTESELGMRVLSKKRVHAIAVFFLFIILARAISARKSRERREREEQLQRKKETLPEAVSVGGPETEEKRSPGAADLPEKEPATESPASIPKRIPPGEPSPEKEEEEEEPGAAGEADDDFVERPIVRARRTRKEVMRKEGARQEVPASIHMPPGIEEEEEMEEEKENVPQPVLPTPAAPTTQPTVPQLPEHPPAGAASGLHADILDPAFPPASAVVPPYENPVPRPIMQHGEDEELQELRARRGVISNLVGVAIRLADELPSREAHGLVHTLKMNAETAEKAERAYDLAKNRNDPSLPSIRGEAISLLRASIEGSREALLQMANVAKDYGHQVQMYCRNNLFFTNIDRLRKPLEDCLEVKPIKLAIATLGSVGSTSISLQDENQDQLALLNSATFIDECEAQDFIQVFGAVSALNFRQKVLERLSGLDSALKEDILDFQKSWVRGRLQFDRVPLEVDAHLIQELHVILCKTRPAPMGQSPSGITDGDMQLLMDLFTQHYQDVNSLDSCQDFDSVEAASARAKVSIDKLRYSLQVLKERLHSVLERNPLNKEESSNASEAMARIAEAAITDSEECWRYVQSVYTEVSGKSDDGHGFTGGKALLQRFTTKKKTGTSDQGEAAASPDSTVANAVKKHFSELWRNVESLTKDQLARAQEIMEKSKKGAKYKLDKDGFGSSALEKKTNLRVEAARKKVEAAASLLQLRYFYKLTKEIEAYDGMFNTLFIFPFQPESPERTHVGLLKDRFEAEKTMARDTTIYDVIPECADTMLQTVVKAWILLENERLAQLKAAIHKPRVDLHDAARE